MESLTNGQLAELDKESLIAIIVELREVIVKQTTQIQELRDQLAKNSQNSGKPPSSDGLKKPRTRSSRKKGERSRGGQPGHQGQTLEMVAEPEHIVRHTLDICPHCTANLKEVKSIGVEKRQVFDLPPVKIEVTEHQVECKRCPTCGQVVKGRFPDEVRQPVQYGPRITAQAVYLNSYQLLPLARLCELFNDFYGHAPSEAFILQATANLVEQTRPTVEAIKAQLKAAAVVHFDESGVRVEGGLNWLHVAGTEQLTYYQVHPKRGQTAMRDMGILPEFQGRAVHDHWTSYLQFETCQHAFCNAHHLRELQFVVDQYEQPWAQNMIDLLLTIKAEVAAAPPDALTLPPERMAHYEQCYAAILQQGFQANRPPEHPPPKKRGRKKQSPPKNLLDRLHQYQAETLAFMYDFRVPFDNNLAERDVRMIKVKQKISGTFRSRTGADSFCATRSYISTVRKQGHHVIRAIHDALLGQPFMPAMAE
jgi:transposase